MNKLAYDLGKLVAALSVLKNPKVNRPLVGSAIGGGTGYGIADDKNKGKGVLLGALLGGSLGGLAAKLPPKPITPAITAPVAKVEEAVTQAAPAAFKTPMAEDPRHAEVLKKLQEIRKQLSAFTPKKKPSSDMEIARKKILDKRMKEKINKARARKK